MKVKIKLMIAAICFAIIPMVAFAIVTNMLVKSDGKERFEQELTNLAQAQTYNLQGVFAQANTDLSTLLDLPGVKEFAKSGSADKADDALNRYVADSTVLGAASLVDSSGKIVAGTNKGNSYDGFEAYDSYADGALYFDEFDTTGDGTGNASLFMKTKVGDGTMFFSYLLGSDSSILSRFTRTFYDRGSVAVIDSKNLWSSGISINTTAEKIFTSTIMDRIAELEDDVTTEIIHFDNDANAGIITKSGGANGLAVVTYCPVNKAGVYSGKFATPVIGITALIGVLSIIGAIIVSRNVTKPLTRISDALEKILRGDHEARISTMTNNEYGQMSRAFNNVVDQIVVSEDRYKVISDMSDNIIFEWNFKTMDVIFSNNFNKKFSFRPQSDHFGDSFLMKAKLHPDDAEKYRADLDGLEKGRNLENNEYRIKNIYGDFIWILIRTATLNDAEGNPLKAVGVMVDIDRAKKSEAKLTEQASYDALTELYNRETIESQIDNEISLSEMRKSEMAVLFIDVDDFKHYNDNYSHATGDQVLKFLAKTIKETVEGIGFAGRYGGDEFIAMIRSAETNDPAQIAAKIIERLAAGFDADVGEHLSVSVSIGIAVIKDDYNTRVEYLIGKADDAMYSVKKSGKSNYAFI